MMFNFDASSTSAIFIGFLVASSTVLSPLLLSVLTTRTRRKERIEDFERQDAVALQAAEAAKLLSERQDAAANKAAEAARLLAVNTAKVAETAKDAADTAKKANDKLDIIHVLVNSNMTAALQAELGATERELALMMEVIELRKGVGRDPNVETLATVEATRNKIGELRATLMDRMNQQTKINSGGTL
jgi:hypothetical protein